MDLPFSDPGGFYPVPDDPLLSGKRRQAPCSEEPGFLWKSRDHRKGSGDLRGNGTKFPELHERRACSSSGAL